MKLCYSQFTPGNLAHSYLTQKRRTNSHCSPLPSANADHFLTCITSDTPTKTKVSVAFSCCVIMTLKDFTCLENNEVILLLFLTSELLYFS